VRPLLEVRRLRKEFPVLSPLVRRRIGVRVALGGVDLSVGSGEILALVGESGSGKSTLARVLLRLTEPSEGEIRFRGADWLAVPPVELRSRRRQIQPVFQDPMASLDPRQRVRSAVEEPLRIHHSTGARIATVLAAELLREVGLCEEILDRFPHELSGGQRQRVTIARALATTPDLLIADEPLSALDASLAAQVANLFLALRRDRGLALLLISHDLAMVGRIADRVAVLHRGRIVEAGNARRVLGSPLHPFTVQLLAARPCRREVGRRRPGGRRVERRGPANPWSSGCAHADRCPIARPRCRELRPELTSAGVDRFVACHFAGDLGFVESSARMEPFAPPDVMRSDAETGATERGIER